jgi:prevent-host-death family protein
MIFAGFAELRRKAASYFDRVENGETVVVTRNGRPIAEIVPFSGTSGKPSWKRVPSRMSIKGVRISREIRADRDAGRA